MEINLQLPQPYQKQRDAIWTPERYAFIEASTKAGKTVGCLLWQFERVLSGGAGNVNHWWVAPVYPQADIAYRRAVAMLRECRLPTSVYTANGSDKCIRFQGAGAWWFKSAEKPDNLYGEDVHSVVEDEASRMREESHHAIRTTLTHTKGPLRSIGNTRGRGNWWYRMCRKAESGAQGMAYHKIICWDAVEAGVLEREEVEDAQAHLPDHVFRELYLCEPADDGGNPFGIKAIEACVAPMSTKPAVVFGVDLAKHQDWTVVIGLDESGQVCRLDRWRAPWNETEERVLSMVGSTPTLCDATGVGDPIVERLARRNEKVAGFTFTGPSKQQLMEGLAAAIQQGRVRFPDGPIRDELETFEYELRANGGVRYSAPDGLHDDCVCALALAVQHKAQAKPPATVVAFGMRRPAFASSGRGAW